MAKIKVGVIGCGGIASNKHLPAMQQTGLCEVAALCDIIPERAEKARQKFAPEAKTFTDYRQLLALKLDAVYVCTPNRSHSEITVAALDSGKHVMCEKPMAINYEEAKKMTEAAKRSGKLLTIGYQNRYRNDSLYLKRECEAGTLGDIYYARAKAIRRRAVPTWGVFLNEYEQGGGPLIDIGTHALDLTLWMMDNYSPKAVSGTVFHKLNNDTETGNAFGDWNPAEFTVEDASFGFIRMENGAIIYLEATWALNSLDVGEAQTILCGTKGGADMNDGLTLNGVRFGRQYVTKPTLDMGSVAFFSGEDESPQLREQMVFLNAILGKNELTVLPEQAMEVTRILDAVYASAKSGNQISF